MGAIMEPTSEPELITRYLLPAFQALFDDDKRAIMIRWQVLTNDRYAVELILFDKTTAQSVGVKKSLSSTNKSNCIISIIKCNYPKDNLGFGEAKSPMKTGNHFAVNKDLFRLGTF